MMLSNNKEMLYQSTNPLTFLGWLEVQEKVSPDFGVNLKNYQIYLKDWSKTKNSKTIQSDNFFSGLYVDLLKEITLNFVTEEEKRFIVNFDYSKTDNLDIILPFFIEKIKTICLYYSNQRELLKRKVSILPYKGTSTSIEKTVKNIILDGIESGVATKAGEGRVSFPSLSAINKNLNVYVEELYDGKNYYSDSNISQNLPNVDSLNIDPNLYLDFKNSIINAIRQYPLLIDNLISPFSINYTLSGDELNLLRSRDFINYIQTLSSQDLKLNLIKNLYPKYVSSDFYYLSVGNTLNEVYSGLLFSTAPPSGAKVQNLTNREYPNIATVQSLNDVYAAYEIGRFFTPSNTGVLQYNTFNKQFYINYNKLTPNSTYVFPDPDIVESAKENFPLIYKIDVSWNKVKPSEGFRFGDVISEGRFQRFYSYESTSQDLGVQPFGLSLSKDNVDFWGSEKSDTWTESDLWPGLDDVENLPIRERTQSLLFDQGELTQWFTDIYGNEFGLYKKINENDTLFNKKKSLPGKLYVKNTLTNLVSTSEHFFKKIFLKYPAEISNELLGNNIISINVVKNVFVIETVNYVIADSYEFEFSTGTFLNTLVPGIYINKHEINQNLEKFINSFYVESSNKLYLCFLKLLPELSASNYKNIYPAIYELDVDSLDFRQRYPGNTFDISFHTLSSKNYDNFPEIDLRYIEGGKFSYKEKFNIFNLTYYAYNINQIPFVVNEQFSISDGSGDFVSYLPVLNKPYFYTRDINFSNPTPDFNLRFTGNYSEPAGYNDLSNLNVDLLDSNYSNYHYNTKVNPVFLNIPGNHYVHFDFDQYIYGNLFVGCNNIKVTKIEGSNFIEYFTNNNIASSIRIQEDNKWFKVRDYIFDNYVFTLSAYRPKNTNNSIILFNINTPLTGFSGVFCDNLYSVYKQVNIVKSGNGIGLVTSDPFCVDCGDLCEFLYPEYGTLVLVPSSAPKSVFGGWIGGNCTGLAGNCFVTVTDNTSITAVFNKIPEYTLKVTSNLPDTSVITLDNKITCGVSCSAIYLEGEVAVLSASPAPVGYFFNGFAGSPCGGNNPCNLLMSTNYSVTAEYLSAESTIFLSKSYNNNNFDTEIGAILARVDGVGKDLITSENNILAYNKGEYNLGTILCSLSPDTPIKGFAEFITQRNESVTITAVEDQSVFKRYEGSPCQNSGQICSFFATNNYSITGYFGSPTYTINILTSGSGLFYVQTDRGGIDCGHRSIINFKDVCTATFLSGTAVTFSAIGIGSARMLYISGSNFYSQAPDINAGEPFLEVTSTITKNDTLIVASKSTIDRTLTVIKSGAFNASNTYLQSIIDIDEGVFSKNRVPAGVERQTFLLDDQATVSIYPSLIPSISYYLYTVGSSGLYYLYESNPVFNFTNSDNPTQTPVLLYQNDTVTSNTLALQLIPSTGDIPLYSLIGSGLVSIEGDKKAYLTLDQSATAIVVFADINYLTKQENINDPIYTQSGELIYK